MANSDTRTSLSGTWPGGAKWEFFLSNRALDPALCTTVACVAIRDLKRNLNDTEVVLTYDRKRTGWEMLGGHLDPLGGGKRETLEQALSRESLEEAGFAIARMVPFGYRKVTNPASSKYPPESFTPFYWATTKSSLRAPTDPEKPPCGTFRMDSVRQLADAGIMKADEFAIVKYGVEAAIRGGR